MIKRMLLSSLSLVFLILALFLIFGREEEVVGCFPTRRARGASLAALRAEVSIAKELQAAPCAEADSSRKQLYEEIQLARLERILVPLSDFGGRELSKILVNEQEVCYIYSDASRSVILVRVSRPDAALRSRFINGMRQSMAERPKRRNICTIGNGATSFPSSTAAVCRSVCAKTTRAIPFPI